MILTQGGLAGLRAYKCELLLTRQQAAEHYDLLQERLRRMFPALTEEAIEAAAAADEPPAPPPEEEDPVYQALTVCISFRDALTVMQRIYDILHAGWEFTPVGASDVAVNSILFTHAQGAQRGVWQALALGTILLRDGKLPPGQVEALFGQREATLKELDKWNRIRQMNAPRNALVAVCNWCTHFNQARRRKYARLTLRERIQAYLDGNRAAPERKRRCLRGMLKTGIPAELIAEFGELDQVPPGSR